MKKTLKHILSFFKRRKKKKGKQKRRWILNVFIALISLGIFATGGLMIWASTLKIPDFEHFDDTLISESTKIYDRTGEILLYDVHGDVERTVVPLDKISPDLQHASIALEDRGFYNHPGIDISAIFRALWVDIRTGSFSQGGSTITQQVAKNAFLSNKKTLLRKAKEAIIAIKIDHEMTKDQILQIYLNMIPYGGSIYGIEEASLNYFGVHASELDLAQAAYLASLPQAPTYYLNNPKELEKRKNYALKRMLDLGYINKSDYEEAVSEDVSFIAQDTRGIKAPAFVMYVLGNLEKKYGREEIEKGGLKVVTTLDYELYKKAQEVVYKAALENAKVNNARNMGMIGIDPKTGEILLMIGSRNYYDEKIPGEFNVTIHNNRQPGSAFKPFVYATAFEKGYTPATTIFDIPTQFSTHCKPFQTTPDECGYAPQNYDLKFRGPVSFRDALAQSINVPAVKVLYLTGIDRAIKQAQAMGITGLKDKDTYGLTLVLGGGEVSVLDMASAYGVFATGGLRNDYTAIRKIVDKNGDTIEENKPTPRRVLQKQAALEISDILTDNIARAPLYGLNSPLYFGGKDVAVKTGTTNNYKDAWTVGYTKNFSLAAWAGNNNNDSMAKKVSGYIITPTWRKVMDLALESYPAEPFEKPQPIPQDIKPVLRGIWRHGSTSGRNNLFDSLFNSSETSNTGDVHSILYWLDKDDPRGPRPSNPASDPQYRLWEPEVESWVRNGGVASGTGTPSEPGPKTGIHIETPQSDEHFSKNDTITVTISGEELERVQKIDVLVNNFYVGSDTSPPFEVRFTPRDVHKIKETNTLKVLTKTKNGATAIYTQTFRVEGD